MGSQRGPRVTTVPSGTWGVNQAQEAAARTARAADDRCPSLRGERPTEVVGPLYILGRGRNGAAFVDPCGRGVINAEPCPRELGRELSSRPRRINLIACIIASSMAFIDGSVLTVASPKGRTALATDLAVSFTDLGGKSARPGTTEWLRVRQRGTTSPRVDRAVPARRPFGDQRGVDGVY